MPRSSIPAQHGRGSLRYRVRPTRNATANLNPNSNTVFYGTTASQTLTLPTPPQTGTVCIIQNTASVAVTISGGGRAIYYLGAGSLTSISLAAGYSVQCFWDNSLASWYCVPANVASFGPVGNVRIGAITPATGDYTAAQVTNAADKSSATSQAFSGIVQAPGFADTSISSGGPLALSGLMSHVAAGTLTTPDQNTSGRDIHVNIGVINATSTAITASLQASSDDSADFATVWQYLTTGTIPADTDRRWVNLKVPKGWWLQWSAFSNATISGTPNYY